MNVFHTFTYAFFHNYMVNNSEIKFALNRSLTSRYAVLLILDIPIGTPVQQWAQPFHHESHFSV